MNKKTWREELDQYKAIKQEFDQYAGVMTDYEKSVIGRDIEGRRKRLYSDIAAGMIGEYDATMQRAIEALKVLKEFVAIRAELIEVGELMDGINPITNPNKDSQFSIALMHSIEL